VSRSGPPTEAPDRVAAFFDIDRTILVSNSAASFARYMWEVGIARPRDLLFATWYLGLYRMGLLDPGQVLERSAEMLRGRPEAWLVDHCALWYERDVRSEVRAGARAHIESHRRADHRVVLLSSSTCYLGNPLGDDLGIEHRLVNRLELDGDGRFTGAFVQPLCYGEGKRWHAERFAREHGVDLAASYFYTDSVTDLAMLELVGHPRVVAPDPRLARVARKRGWPVVDLDDERRAPDLVGEASRDRAEAP
jgi:HAD superfamily hydrolase (TIGR01490 family)